MLGLRSRTQRKVRPEFAPGHSPQVYGPRLRCAAFRGWALCVCLWRRWRRSRRQTDDAVNIDLGTVVLVQPTQVPCAGFGQPEAFGRVRGTVNDEVGGSQIDGLLQYGAAGEPFEVLLELQERFRKKPE